jgi:hypothetical protein
MNSKQRLLRLVSLLFLLPGLAGLIVSAMVSTYDLEHFPRAAIPSESRMTPRNIHGTVVYQTWREDQRLTIMEDTSVGVFLIGLGLGLVYLRKWGIANAISGETDDYEMERP